MTDHSGGIGMNISITKNGTELNVAVEGRLDTLTSPELEEKLGDELDGSLRFRQA